MFFKTLFAQRKTLKGTAKFNRVFITTENSEDAEDAEKTLPLSLSLAVSAVSAVYREGFIPVFVINCKFNRGYTQESKQSSRCRLYKTIV